MKLRKRSENAAQGVVDQLKISPSKKQMEKIIRVIEQAIAEAVVEQRAKCENVVAKRGANDSDLAHEITREIRRKTDALVANLSAMR